MPTAVSLSASSRRVTGTTGWSSRRELLAAGAGDAEPHARLPSTAGSGAVEAAALAGVAGRALLVDQQEQRVAVAVQAHVAHPLAVPRGLALHPVLAAAARPVGRPAGGEGAVQRLVVHPGEHEHLAGVVLLHHGGHQARGVAAQQRGDRGVECGSCGHAASVPCRPVRPAAVPSNQPRPGPSRTRPSPTSGADGEDQREGGERALVERARDVAQHRVQPDPPVGREQRPGPRAPRRAAARRSWTAGSAPRRRRRRAGRRRAGRPRRGRCPRRRAPARCPTRTLAGACPAAKPISDTANHT